MTSPVTHDGDAWGKPSERILSRLPLCVSGVRGLQGEDISQPDRVAACLKHFVGYSAAIGGRDYSHTGIPVFAMRNFFLPVFWVGVRAGVATVMTAFNANDGIPSSTNRYLLTQVLRNEWKFSGFVVSDWEAVAETIRWGGSR